MPEETVYAIGYARISDLKQLEGASLETQEKSIRQRCAERGWVVLDVVKEVYSGAYLVERKLLNEEVRKRVREHSVNVVVVNSFDRLSRDQIHQAVLLHEMMENGVALESVTEELDTSPLGNFLRQAIGFAAALEREKIIERASRGIQNRVDKGQMIGVGVPKFGYSWGEDHKYYLINESEARIVREVFERYVIQGHSMRSIAKWLNDAKVPTRLKGRKGKPGQWVASTIKNMIASEEYRGVAYNRTWKWERVNGHRKNVGHPDPVQLPDGVVPRLVSDDLWYAAQAKRAVAKAESPRNNRMPDESLLRGGFIFCGYCGRPMQVSRERHYFSTEKNRMRHRKTQYVCDSGGDRPGRCKSRTTITAEIIDAAVWEAVKQVLDRLDRVRRVLTAPTINNAEAELKSLSLQIEETKEEIMRRVKDMEGLRGYTREAVQNELAIKEKHLEGLEQLKRQVTPNAKREEGVQKDIEAFLAWCLAFKGDYDAANYEEKRRALRHLGVKVLVYQNQDPTKPKYKITGRPELFARLRLKRPEKGGNATNCVQVSSHTATLYPLPTRRAI